MFLEYYGLREQPFGVTPDPRFLYFGATHREALASLFYGIESGCGFLSLIAPPGMGKTTLLFHLLEKLRHSAQTVFLFQTQCGSREMFRHLLNDLGINSNEQDLASMHESLNAVLLNNARKGRRVVLVIDEAQNLKESVLETVRLLSDFETPQAKLLQIVLSGQPQLADKLSHPSLTQLRQRISVVARLNPFTRIETLVYIEYRLCRAGYAGPPIFSYSAADLIAAHSKGIPRVINNLCFNALTLGFAKRQKQIDAATMCEVIEDLDLDGLCTHNSIVPDAAEDSLTSFDGIAPSNDVTYQDFHDAVRAAWGNGAPIKPEDKAAHDIQKDIGTNGAQLPVEAAVRMNADSDDAGTVIEVDPAEDPANAIGSEPSPVSAASAIVLADEAKAADQEEPPQPAAAESPAAEPGENKLDFAILKSAFVQVLQDAFKKGTRTAAKERAILGGILVIVALGSTASGLLWGWEHHALAEAPPPVTAIAPSPSSMDILQPSVPEKHKRFRATSKKDQSAMAGAASQPSPATEQREQTLGQASPAHPRQFKVKVTGNIPTAKPEMKNPDVTFDKPQMRLPDTPAQTGGSASTSGEVANRRAEEQR